MDREVELREFVSAPGAALARAVVLPQPAVCSSAPTDSPTREQRTSTRRSPQTEAPSDPNPDAVRGLRARLGTRPLHATTRVATNTHLQTRRTA